MHRASFIFFVALLLVPSIAWAQGNPLGPEFRVNTNTTDEQEFPAVASDASGNFVVVWEGLGGNGSDRGVFGQRYASTGEPLGPEFHVNTYTTDPQTQPAVASDASGNFVVAWQSNSQDGSGDGIFGQRYDGSGAPLGPEFRVNTYTTDFQQMPAVASDSSGNFVIVWESVSQDGSNRGVFGQRYDSSGAPLGPEFQVNTYTTYAQARPDVASDSSGNFVIVWQGPGQEGAVDVLGQVFANSGAPLGREFRVNTYTTSFQSSPSVAADASGNFVVVWSSQYQDGSFGGIFGQRYDSSGTALGPEFRVNTYTTYAQVFPSVALDASGNFVVVWTDFAQDGSGSGVFGQRYASSGVPRGPEFRVNTFTPNAQNASSVAVDSSGRFVVVWQSYTQDGSNYGVFGQRYSRIVAIVPSWRP